MGWISTKIYTSELILCFTIYTGKGSFVLDTIKPAKIATAACRVVRDLLCVGRQKAKISIKVY